MMLLLAILICNLIAGISILWHRKAWDKEVVKRDKTKSERARPPNI